MKRMFRNLGYVCAFGVVLGDMCSAAYTIVDPTAGSIRGTMNSVAGTGQGQTTEGAVFKFGRVADAGGWEYHEETPILATAAIPGMNRGPWVKDLAPPTTGWKKSAEPMPGMFSGDHIATVDRGSTIDGITLGHVINGT